MEEWAREAIVSYGYLGLAALILIENLFPPIPSELILPLAGSFVATGDMQFVPAVLAATVGSVTGAVLLYGIARAGGHALLVELAPFLRINEREIARGEALLRRHGAAIVFFGRLVPGVRSLVSLPAGLARMNLTKFLVYTILGSALWNTMLIGFGYGLRDNYEHVATIVGPLSRVVLVAVVVGTVVGIVMLRRRRRRRRT